MVRQQMEIWKLLHRALEPVILRFRRKGNYQFFNSCLVFYTADKYRWVASCRWHLRNEIIHFGYVIKGSALQMRYREEMRQSWKLFKVSCLFRETLVRNSTCETGRKWKMWFKETIWTLSQGTQWLQEKT